MHCIIKDCSQNEKKLPILIMQIENNFRDCITVCNRDSLSDNEGSLSLKSEVLRFRSERHCKGD